MGLGDTVFKATTGLLGLTTLGAGVWFAGTMFSGFSKHRQLTKAKEAEEVAGKQ